MTAVAEPTIEERVEAGAALLDREHPGWWRTIDVDKLAMEDKCRCVLGQIWGDYYLAPITLQDAIRCGFDAAEDGDVALCRAEFDALTDTWWDLIQRRRAEAGAAP